MLTFTTNLLGTVGILLIGHYFHSVELGIGIWLVWVTIPTYKG